MANSAKVAIVAALEREVRPLIKCWHVSQQEYAGRKFKFFENDRAVLVCSGIGAEAARRACEAVIMLYQPARVVSVGFAGALEPALKAGEIFAPRYVIDASDGSKVETGEGNGILVSLAAVAGAAQKSKLAKAYDAQAVDMEAAAVGLGAQARGLRFAVLKAISDESGFDMPAMERFVGRDGRFRSGRFLAFTVIRPWLWPRVIQLTRNSSRASHALCARLDQYNRPAEESETSRLQPIVSQER